MCEPWWLHQKDKIECIGIKDISGMMVLHIECYYCVNFPFLGCTNSGRNSCEGKRACLDLNLILPSDGLSSWTSWLILALITVYPLKLHLPMTVSFSYTFQKKPVFPFSLNLNFSMFLTFSNIIHSFTVLVKIMVIIHKYKMEVDGKSQVFLVNSHPHRPPKN